MRNVAKAQNYNSRKFGLKMQLKIRSTIFFHKTTAFTHTVYFFKIRRNGFRRIGTEPFLGD